MYSKTKDRIEKITRQLEDLSYILIESEGEDYQEALEETERLQEELEFLMIHQADMETMKDFLGDNNDE